MPLASVGCTIVLLLNVMLESALGYDQIARPSSPSLRRKLFFTVQLDALPLKFRPSASVDSTTLFSTVQLLLPYWSQNPTLVSSIQRPSTVQPLPSDPSIALAELSSCRPTVLPRIAKPLRLTGPETAPEFLMNMLVSSCEYQEPAPMNEASITESDEPILYVPGGIHTGSFAEFAALIALLNALDESLAPVGSAP